MKKKLANILLAAAIVVALVLPTTSALADEGKHKGHDKHPTVIGQEAQVDKYTKVKLVKNNYDNNGKKVSSDYEAIISTLPIVTDDGQPIDVQWYKQKDSAGYKYYESGNNLFTALATPKGRTSIQDSDNRLFVWTPILSVGTQNLDCGKPKILFTDPINDYYHNNVLQWTYELKTGLFKTNKVTIQRQLRIIEGSLLEYYILDGNPGDDFVVLRSTESELGAEGSLTDAIAFDSSGRPQYLQVDNYHNGFTIPANEFFNKAYPIIIDPESSFTTSASDGDLRFSAAEASSSSSWSAAHDAASATDLYSSDTLAGPSIVTKYRSSNNTYYTYVYRSFVYFDTSGISDEVTILSATLKLYKGTLSSDFGTWSLQVQSGMPTYPHDPFIASNYYYTYYTGNGGSISSSSIISGYNSIHINSTGQGWIDKTGFTKFCLMEKEHDINNVNPSYETDTWNSNTFDYYTYEQGTNYAPQLIVTYTAPIVPPTASTIEAIDVDKTSMTLKGYLDNDGGESCVVKFEYGTTTAYGYYSTTVPLKVTDDYFSIGITGLTRGTTYHFRAVATNTAGTSHGLDKTATTLPAEPNSLAATAGDQQNVLTWAKGSGANKTMVRRKTTGYPSSISDGTEEYFDTGTGFTDLTLTEGITYYYSAWSEVSGQYSIDYDTAYATPYYTDAPDTTTRDITAIGVSTATLNGYLDALNQVGGTVDCTLQYYHGAGSWVDNETDIDELGAYGSFGEAVTGLEAATLYHVRAKAVGDNGTGYGSDVTFTTGANSAPTMTTQAATGTGLSYTTINGKVAADGGLDVTAWYIWGLSADNLNQTTGTATGLQTDDTFPCSLSGLEPDTQYYFQAVGQNTVGIGYGSVLDFTTDAPSAPTVTTNDASDVGANKATLSGIVTSDGGVECEVQFEWDTDTGAPYANSTGWQAGYSTGEPFEAPISGLTVGQDYFFRASVKNADSTVHGDEKTFTTIFVAPTNFTAKSIGATTISLTWTKQGDQTYIVYKTTGYPVDRLDGTQVYFGDASSATHDSLNPGVTYFYRAWSWRSGDVWSGTYASDAATTLPVKTSEERETPNVLPSPGEPDDFYMDPSTDRLDNIPGIESIHAGADTLGMPRGNFLLILSMGLLIVLGLIVYVPTNSVGLTAFVMGAGIILAGWLGIMPGWIAYMFGGLAVVSSSVVQFRGN